MLQHSDATRLSFPALGLSTCLLMAGASAPSLAQTPGAGLIFTDVTAETGVALPNTLNESVAWADYDNDGDQDLYLTNDGPNKLFRNNGDGTFTEVAVAVGVDHPGFSVGTAFGDLDNDGDLDLYVVSFNTGPDVLYRNDGPNGTGGEYTFTDITAPAGVTSQSSSRGVALIDYDRDGLLDIYVNAIGSDILYHNRGGLRFANVANALGVGTAGQGVGVVATDLDNDGWIDLYTGNRSGDLNRLYLNNGGTFTDVTLPAGIDKTGLGMGVLSFDYDNDLDFDLYWTVWPGSGSPQPNALYENLGSGTRFVDIAAQSGTNDADGWGISCNTGDIDNDGWEDFFVTNGFDPSTSANVLFLNNRDSTFSDVTALLGGADFDGRGVAFADYDNDGDVDLCVTGGPNANTRLWRNDTANGNRWLTLDLVGTRSNRSAIGARVEVVTDLGTTVKEVSGGAGRGSQNSLPLELGLGPASVLSEVRIRWPSGQLETLRGLALDQFLTVIESGAVDECPIAAGDPGYCAACGPCASGQGACRTDDECAVGLVCMENFGAAFGFAPRREVCVAPASLVAPTYVATELPAVAGSQGPLDLVTPHAINNAGQVVGQARDANGASSGFRFTPSTGMEKLDPAGNDSSAAWTINESGDVFGYVFAPGSPRQSGFFLYRDEGGLDLLEVGANNALRSGFEVFHMNDAGDLVGAFFSRARNQRIPYLYTAADGWTSLDGLHRRFRLSGAVAQRINNRGEILLLSESGDGTSQAFALFAGDDLVELGDFGGDVNIPSAINDNGRVAGLARNDAGLAHAYVVKGRGGRPIDIHPRSFRESRALAVSAKGVMGGVLANAAADTLFTWDSRRRRKLQVQARRGDFRALLGAGSTFREIHGIQVNERLEFVGRVSGAAADGTPVERFFYLSPPFGLIDVQDLLTAAGSGRTVADVVGINDWGEILARTEDNGSSTAIVLSPTGN